MTTVHTTRSVYRRGADDGWWFGIYLTVLFIVSAYSLRVPVLAPVTFALALAVPFIVFFVLRRSYLAERCRDSFSALWLQGIVMFFCGCLIMALATYLFLRFIYPDYIMEAVTSTIAVLKESPGPETDFYSRGFQAMVDGHALPTPITMALSLIWTGVFTGSILSMILAAIVKATQRQAKKL